MFKIEYLEYGKTQGITTNDIKDVGQILINIVNDERTEHEAMLWCSNAHWGDTFVNQKYKFSIQCVYDEKHVLKPGIHGGKQKSINLGINSSKTLRNEDILRSIKTAITSKSEWHCRIYDDGCWWIDIERHPYGHIRFWVGFEDKRSGKSKSSIVTISRLNNNGDLRYNTDGIMLKQSVWNKIQSVVKMLLKEKIINIL